MRVAELMHTHLVQRLFVDDDGALVGVISQTDIIGAVATAKVAVAGVQGRG